MNDQTDTICAISTALGGAVCIVRISGPEADRAASAVWRGRTALTSCPPRELVLGKLTGTDGVVIDPQCLAVRMPGPRSYTGEDVVELQCHGGMLCARMALSALQHEGVRLAEPGEFTKRAFLNGQLDLTQAEAVADLIDAGNERALKAAGRQLSGLLGRQIRDAYGRLSDVLAEVESRLDFPEEELEWRDAEEMCGVVDAIAGDVDRLLRTRREGEILRSGVSMVIAGAPNVGKSSLLNTLLGRDRAIVTDIPGTTRDTIETSLTIRGIPIRLVDTAGIRENGDDVERLGIERSRESAEAADIVLWLHDAAATSDSIPPSDWTFCGHVMVVANKVDRLSAEERKGLKSDVCISVKTGEGLEELYDAIEAAVGTDMTEHPDEVAVAERHAGLLEAAATSLAPVSAQMRHGDWELAALSLRDAISHLGRITGQSVDPDVLATIFSRFCIGK